jgi:DNA-3-methyladenine glycosylase
MEGFCRDGKAGMRGFRRNLPSTGVSGEPRQVPRMERLTPEFFTADPVDCAKNLIGCHFVWKGCSGRIVETEAYHATGDEACHTWHRPSARAFMETHGAGDAYVYLNYGVHWLFNITVKGPSGDGFVLLRALEPVGEIAEMKRRRGDIPERMLMSGPGKMTQALGIAAADHGSPFLNARDTGIHSGGPVEIVSGPRIGISKAAHLPWRFGEAGSRHLSKPF